MQQQRDVSIKLNSDGNIVTTIADTSLQKDFKEAIIPVLRLKLQWQADRLDIEAKYEIDVEMASIVDGEDDIP